MVESFFATLTKELLVDGLFESRAIAHREPVSVQRDLVQSTAAAFVARLPISRSVRSRAPTSQLNQVSTKPGELHVPKPPNYPLQVLLGTLPIRVGTGVAGPHLLRKAMTEQELRIDFDVRKRSGNEATDRSHYSVNDRSMRASCELDGHCRPRNARD